MPWRSGQNHLELRCRWRGVWIPEREVPGPDAAGQHLEPYSADAASSPCHSHTPDGHTDALRYAMREEGHHAQEELRQATPVQLEAPGRTARPVYRPKPPAKESQPASGFAITCEPPPTATTTSAARPRTRPSQSRMFRRAKSRSRFASSAPKKARVR